KASNRDTIIPLLKSFIQENTSYSIFRFDIKEFYESFDRQKVQEKIKSDSFISKSSLRVLELLFIELNRINSKGLVRGLGISSIISELMMKDFDLKIKKNKNIFYYARFVDDIVLICSPTTKRSDIKANLSQMLPTPLEFHNSGEKIYYSTLNKTNNTPSNNITHSDEFSFLGYSFSASNNVNKNDKIFNLRKRH
ncbi:reverse transcriptase domain-containing protein, partial [Shewanella colwelliana]|uniref:reverse transcriptase domain-containing protein n=1 Tax=Shewanella colwelliana TaxID=23 RepID=UPI001C7CBA0D